MPRPTLIHFKGALFHVTARGNNKQTIFQDKTDFTRYLENIKKCKKDLPFYLYSLILMPNHVHLLIEVINSPISKIMQKLQTAYTMYANKKYQTVGHVFQGRYFWLLVEKDSHLLELIRYIHLNPVRAGITNNPSNYPWSSHNAYLGLNKEIAELVNIDKVLPYFSSDHTRAIKNYHVFVLEGIGKRWKNIAKEIKRDYILGSRSFVKKIEKRLSKR